MPRLPFTGLTGPIDWHRLTGPSDWRRLSPVRPAPKHALKMAAMPSWARYLWAPGGAMRAVRTVSGAPRVSAAAERGAAALRAAARPARRRAPDFSPFTRRSVAFRIRFRSPAARTALRRRPGRPWAAQGFTIWMSRGDRRPQPAPERIRLRPATPSPIFAAARALIRALIRCLAAAECGWVTGGLGTLKWWRSPPPTPLTHASNDQPVDSAGAGPCHVGVPLSDRNSVAQTALCLVWPEMVLC